MKIYDTFFSIEKDDKEIELLVSFHYYHGSPQTWEQPADLPELEILSATDLETKKDFLEELDEKELIRLQDKYIEVATEDNREYERD